MRYCSTLVALLVLTCAIRADDFFETKIRPVLVEHCYKCHADNKGKEPKGGLRVDSRAALLKGGDNGPSIVPGDPEKSKFIEAVRYGNTDLQMPPKGKLDEKVIADLVKWVKDGPTWPGDSGTAVATTGIDIAKRKAEHWAWQPIGTYAPPTVKDKAWATSDVDRFILSKLEAKGLRPAAPAEARTLIRRVYYDLVGLPPMPAEVDEFVKAAQTDSNAALELVVTKLLDSPHFGERWARHWLDLVRYGESRGHEFDPIIPNAYQYRDYVIRALNADVPYNQFVTEHVAGDLLAKPRLNPKQGFNESILGTGFWFLGEEVHSPVDVRQDQADRFDNRIDVLTKTFMALTVSCARCHDHKFDAITTKDYYALFGILESSSYRLARFDTLEQHRTSATELAKLQRTTSATTAKLLAEGAKPLSEQLAAYLLASRQVILTGPEFRATDSKDVIFEDFESGTYAKWELSGTAFGDRPQTLETIGSYQGKINATGKYFVNSHNLRNKDSITRSDAHQGKMLSQVFTIKHDAITMLVGGGAHKEKTCVNLLLDGKVVRTATGRDNNQMFPVRWEVRDLQGKTARIQIVDEHAGGWGNIGVDDIVFTNRTDKNEQPSSIKSDSFSPAFQGRIKQIAEQHKLDVEQLARWVAIILRAKQDTSNPFHQWAKLASDPKADDVKHFTNLLASLRPKPMELPAGAEVVIDYATSKPEDWRPDDASFGLAPARPGDLRFDGKELRFSELAAAQYDRVWDKLTYAPNTEVDDRSAITRKGRAGRTIRTPTFKINHGRVYYLVRGAGSAYAAVGAHTLIAGPLHGRLVAEFPESATYRWVQHDLTPYNGQYTHIEFTTPGGGDFAIAMVVQAEQTPSLPTTPQIGEGSASLGELAKAYQESFAKRPAPNDSQTTRWANFLLSNRELLDAKAQKELTDTSADFTTQQRKLADSIQAESRLALAILDGNGVDENVFIRGSPKGIGEPVPRRFLEALTGTKAIADKGSGRRELAELMIDPKANPFVTRVLVNRVWHHLFGRGIVASVDNFGLLGETPTHPELLDYLAVKFANDGWSVKKLIRELVLSSTYRMASKADPETDKLDPQNLLLHRMRLRRMEGEVIRDAMLQTSGRLDRTMFGPSVPIYLTAFLDGRGRPSSGPLDGNGRRSLYLATKRNFLSPFLQAFDTPIAFSTVGRRQVSNVPAQALILLNDPFVHQQAALWAKQILAKPLTTTDRIALMYQTAFARSPSEEEIAACGEFLTEQATRYKVKHDDAKPWTDLAHMLFNAKEFIYVD